MDYFINKDINTDKGRFCIGGLWIDRNTDVDMVRLHFNEEPTGNPSFQLFSRDKLFGGEMFRCKLWLDTESVVNFIELMPIQLGLPDNIKSDRLKLQKAVKAVSDEWLRRNIRMKPDIYSETDTVYEYEWGTISTSLRTKADDDFGSGSILIAYKSARIAASDKTT